MENNTERVKPESIQDKVIEKLKHKTNKIVEKKNIVLEKLKIEYVPIDSIFPNEWNPNRQSEHDFELLISSIKEDGFTQPVIVHKSRKIVDGEHRWRAAKAIGFTEIPVVVVDMPIEQMMMSTIRHNRARGSHDIELEAEMIRDLEKLGALDWAVQALMIDDIELNKMLNDIKAPDFFANEEYSQSVEFLRNLDPDKALEEGGNVVSSSTQNAVDKQREITIRLTKAKSEEERAILRKEASVEMFRVYLNFTGEEAKIVKSVLGESPAENILKLCIEKNKV